MESRIEQLKSPVLCEVDWLCRNGGFKWKDGKTDSLRSCHKNHNIVTKQRYVGPQTWSRGGAFVGKSRICMPRPAIVSSIQKPIHEEIISASERGLRIPDGGNTVDCDGYRDKNCQNCHRETTSDYIEELNR